MDQPNIAADVARAREYLSNLPDLARYRDTPARATMDRDLVVRVAGPDGLAAEMLTGIGRTASVPSPGWYFRASLAACIAMFITMRAAEAGAAIGGLAVTVDADSDDRGALGMADVPPGPLEMRVTVQYTDSDRDEGATRDILEWGIAHCPVHDAIVRAVPVSVSIERAAAVDDGVEPAVSQPG